MPSAAHRSGKSRWRLTVCGIGLLAAAVGCGAGTGGSATVASPAGAGQDTAASTATRHDGSAPATHPAGQQAPGKAQPPGRPGGHGANPPRCHTSELDGSVGDRGVATGQAYTDVVLANVGDHACDLDGYPGVSVLGEDKNQLGSAADRNPTSESRQVVLEPGEAASFTVVSGTGSGTGQCRPISTYLRVYPPGSYDSMDIKFQLRVCDHLFTTTTVVAGTDGNLP